MSGTYRTIVADPPWEYAEGFAFKNGDAFSHQELPYWTTHSAKPELFLDLIESISPPPYLELFARRQRLGWDTWGNEALEHVTLDAARPALTTGLLSE